MKVALLIAVTGYADDAYRLLGAEAGFDHYRVKPVEPLIVKQLLREPGAPGEASQNLTVLPGKYGVLVVDDEEPVRALLNVWLRQRGFSVFTAGDGREALDVYRRRREAIDMVLLDVRMPGPDGPATLASLQVLEPGVRFCFMSGEFGKHTEDDLRKLGAAAVFPKPFSLVEVARVLEELASNAGWEPPGL